MFLKKLALGLILAAALAASAVGLFGPSSPKAGAKPAAAPAPTAEKRWRLRGPFTKCSLAAGPLVFSPDGKLLLTTGASTGKKADGTEEKVSDWRLWDTRTGKPGTPVLAPTHKSVVCISGAAFSPDGKHVATTCQFGNVAVWEAATGRRVWDAVAARAGYLVTHAVAFAPDGSWVVTARTNGTIQRRVAATGEVEWDAAVGGGLCSVAVSPDGKTIAAGGKDGTVHLIDAETAKVTASYKQQTAVVRGLVVEVASVAFIRQGKAVVGVTRWGHVEVWDVAAGKAELTLATGDGKVTCETDVTADGTRLAVAEEKGVRVYDLETGKEVALLATKLDDRVSLKFSPDGHTLVLRGFFPPTPGDDGRKWNAGLEFWDFK